MGERRALPDKPLAELTDAELQAELAARRKLRGAVPPEPTAAPAASTALAKHYASLELEEGAPLDAIEAAYARLRAKYQPFAAAADRERSEAARRLLEALRQAYDALKRYSAGNTSR
jgi:DnaJ-domain-containing protein 1